VRHVAQFPLHWSSGDVRPYFQCRKAAVFPVAARLRNEMVASKPLLSPPAPADDALRYVLVGGDTPKEQAHGGIVEESSMTAAVGRSEVPQIEC
jgi:hypothetical protein